MSDYNAYVTSVNKIFDYLSKMKVGWSSLDNKNYIESIEEYKQVVVQNADKFKNEVQESKSLEALGND
jgi:hypothetical protein